MRMGGRLDKAGWLEDQAQALPEEQMQWGFLDRAAEIRGLFRERQ